MPFTFPNGSQYNLLLLDTNVLSEISKDIRGTRLGFIQRFPPNKYAPCFSSYSLVELHNADRAYQAFLDFFSIYPCLMLSPYMAIVRGEIECYKKASVPSFIVNSFSSNGPNETYDLKYWLRNFWQDKSLVSIISNNASEYPHIATDWQKQRQNSTSSYSKEFEEGCLRNILYSIDAKWTVQNSCFDITEFPGTRMMLFSQFMRVHKSKKTLGANDVNDVMISSALPYLDAVITEKSQAEVIRQAKNKIPQLKEIEVATLSEIRTSDSGE